MRLSTALALVLFSGPAEAQVLLVCQTPQFWCSYAWEAPIPDGAPCACFSPQGAIPGRTIVPATYGNGWPPAHAPVAQSPTGQDDAPQNSVGNNSALAPAPKGDNSPRQTSGSDRCLNGLGDCPASPSAD